MLGSLLLTARLLAAAMFVVSGLAKLADRRGSHAAMIDFGVPARLAAPVALVLPPAELAVALALLPRATAWSAAAAALALLLLFSAAIAVNLARGRRPSCHCFGQLSAGPVGWRSLARNAALALPAAFVVVAGRTNAGTSAVDWLTTLRPVEVAGLALALAGYALLGAFAVLAFNLTRQQGRLLDRIDALEAALGGVPAPAQPDAPTPAQSAQGLPVGTPAPAFTLAGLYGETLTLDALLAPHKPVLLLFADPGCGPCAALMPEIGRWQRAHAAMLTIAVVSRGTVEANRAKAAEHGVTPMLLQETDEITRAYEAWGTPSGVLVLPDGTIGSPVRSGADAIRELLQTALAGLATPFAPQLALAPPRAVRPPLLVLPQHGVAQGNGVVPAPPTPVTAPFALGATVPPLTLTDLDGEKISLTDFRSQPVLLLFWNLACGFCQRMLSDLKAWEQIRSIDAPRVLVVSSGTAEANRAMGLQSSVALDHGVGVGAMFGAHGTPMAVLLDGEGRVASDVAAGAPAVFELLNGTSKG